MADSVRARCPVAQGAKRSELFQLVDQLKEFELPKELELWRPDGGPSEPRLAAVVRDEVPSAVDSAEPPSESDPAAAALRAIQRYGGGIRPPDCQAEARTHDDETSGPPTQHGTRA